MRDFFSLFLACIISAAFLQTALAQSEHPISFAVKRSDGTLPNGAVRNPKITPDGNFLVFGSAATNLVANTDSNGTEDIFFLNRSTGAIELISRTSGGSAANGFSSTPDVSSDGRFVVFSSEASNLVAVDTNNTTDVFVHDRQAGTTIKVSTARDGTEGDSFSSFPHITRDGKFITFLSFASNLLGAGFDLNNAQDAFVQNLTTISSGVFTGLSRVSQSSQNGDANGGTFSAIPAISSSGELLVFFESDASNLVTGDTNNETDVFLRSVGFNANERISITSNSTQGNEDSRLSAVSGDGKFVVMNSEASNFVLGDTNRIDDCFLKNRQTGALTLISVGPNGEQSNGQCNDAAISDNGQFIAFESEATSLAPKIFKLTDEVEDVYLRDTVNGVTLQLSLTSTGGPPFEESDSPTMTADGSIVMFVSESNELVQNDTNVADDVFKVQDACLDNPAKLAPGVCGCGALDIDTDEDGTLDCQDACPTDPRGDANNNGAADCLDPDGNTVPSKPAVKVSGRKITITMQDFAGSGIKYRVSLSGARSLTKTSNSEKLTIKDLKPGRYSVRYTLTFNGKVSQVSQAKQFQIR